MPSCRLHSLHTILLGVGGTVYSPYSMEPSSWLRVWRVVNSLYEHLQNTPLFVVAVKLGLQQVLPDLLERREAGNM